MPRWAWALRHLRQPSDKIWAAYEDLYDDSEIAKRAARLTAIHEAGHATTHVFIGSPLIRVTIMPTQLASGRVGGMTEPNNTAMTSEQGLISTLAGVFVTILTEPQDEWSTSIANDLPQAVCHVLRGWGVEQAGNREGIYRLEVAPPGEILSILIAHWNRVCDLLCKAENFRKVRSVANGLLRLGELDATGVCNRMLAASSPSATLVNGLAEALRTIRAMGAALLEQKHSDYLSPSGMRLGNHVNVN